MIEQLDHVVIAVSDLDAAMADYRALGFKVLPGGAHAGRLSHNALVVFADGSYLELIAWRGANDESWYQVLQSDGEGFVDFALLPGDMDADVAAAQARGLDTLRPVAEGGRLRPDGQQVAWKVARQTTRALPFMCGDVTPRGLRVLEDPEVRTHANGVQGIAAVVVAVADLQVEAGRYAALLGVAADAALVAPGAAAAASGWLGAAGVRSQGFALAGTALVLVSPEPGAATPAAQALQRRLQGRGPGPCALVFCGAAPAIPSEPASEPAAAAASSLDATLSHGALLARV
jgi:catechol 2,3-dioxygenase-like lactoylglutathione lyase family enzyme